MRIMQELDLPMPMADATDAQAHAMYGIRVMSPKGRGPGYLVKIGRRKVEYTKWFGFAQYAGEQEALVAAQSWRDELLHSTVPLTKKEFVAQIRPNNTSGTAGVLRTTKRHKKRSGEVVTVEYWLARPPRGIKVSVRNISIPKYGEERAREMAIQARKEMERLSTGYHVPNVPEAFLAASGEHQES